VNEDENRLIAERRAKLQLLRQSGVAYPNDFRRDALAAQLLSTFADRDAAWLESNPVRVRVGGRMMFKRVMGKASFATIADRTGQLQLFLQQSSLGSSYEAFKGFDVGDMIAAEGPLFRTRTGELSVRVETLRLLAKSLRPLPDKWHGVADTELRYRQRYVDLIVTERSREVFRTRTRVLRYLRDFMDALDFLEVETPMMQPIPGGAAARPFVTHHNALDVDMYLRIAPELYLKRLIVGGFERVYEINRNFRNEGLSTQHNPEFTMLELYWAYTDYAELMDLIERLLHGLADGLFASRRVTYQGREYDLSRPFRRITIEAALLEQNPQLDRARLRDVAYLRSVCDELGIAYAPHAGAGKLQIELFEKTVEHTLLDPTFAYAYPLEVSPLSRTNDADPFITDRFEFFLAGRELANGFSELNDPEEQAQRFRAQVQLQARGDEEAMHFDAGHVPDRHAVDPRRAAVSAATARILGFANVGQQLPHGFAAIVPNGVGGQRRIISHAQQQSMRFGNVAQRVIVDAISPRLGASRSGREQNVAADEDRGWRLDALQIQLAVIGDHMQLGLAAIRVAFHARVDCGPSVDDQPRFILAASVLLRGHQGQVVTHVGGDIGSRTRKYGRSLCHNQRRTAVLIQHLPGPWSLGRSAGAQQRRSRQCQRRRRGDPPSRGPSVAVRQSAISRAAQQPVDYVVAAGPDQSLPVSVWQRWAAICTLH